MADDRSSPKNWLGTYADPDRDWLALRAAERHSYLASALAEYIEIRQWTPEQLADRLRCAPQQLAKLGLCMRPDLSSAEFRQQVSQIASRFDLDHLSLRRMLEELALEPNQRQRHWISEDLFNQHRHRTPALGNSREFRRTFGIPDATNSQDFLEDVVTQASSRHNHGAEIPTPEQAYAPAGFTTPKAATPRKSWLGRLFDTIRNLFSRK